MRCRAIKCSQSLLSENSLIQTIVAPDHQTVHKGFVICIGLLLTKGAPFEIKWRPDTKGLVSLDLGTGVDFDIKVVERIAFEINNTGVRRLKHHFC